jgi:hypothetical protein
MAFMGRVLMETRNGLVVGSRLTPATGPAEREAVLSPIDGMAAKRRGTLGAGTKIRRVLVEGLPPTNNVLT